MSAGAQSKNATSESLKETLQLAIVAKRAVEKCISREPQETLQLAIVDKRADSGQRGPLKKRATFEALALIGALAFGATCVPSANKDCVS